MGRQRRVGPGGVVCSSASTRSGGVVRPSGKVTTSTDGDTKDNKVVRPQEAEKEKKPKWTGKTPKVLLHDYTQKNKWPGPRYKTTPVEGTYMHRSSVKIVERTPKGKDDIYHNFHAEGEFQSEEEASQFSALSALAALRPTEPLYRLLGSPFRDEWAGYVSRHKERQAEKEAREERRAVREEKTKLREERAEARARADARLESVPLSKDDADELLQMLRNELTQASPVCPSFVPDDLRAESLPDWTAPVVRRLQSLGIVENLAAAATSASLKILSLEQDGVDVDNLSQKQKGDSSAVDSMVTHALDWLVLHVPEGQLPASLRPESNVLEFVGMEELRKSLSQPIVDVKDESAFAAPTDQKEKCRHVCKNSSKQQPSQPQERPDAQPAALRPEYEIQDKDPWLEGATKGKLSPALVYWCVGITEPRGRKKPIDSLNEVAQRILSTRGSENGDEDNGEWDDEVEVLRAMFGMDGLDDDDDLGRDGDAGAGFVLLDDRPDDFRFVQISVKNDSLIKDGSAFFRAFIPKHCRYPHSLPLFSFTFQRSTWLQLPSDLTIDSAWITEQDLRQITSSLLRKHAEGLSGMPMFVELWATLQGSEFVEELFTAVRERKVACEAKTRTETGRDQSRDVIARAVPSSWEDDAICEDPNSCRIADSVESTKGKCGKEETPKQGQNGVDSARPGETGKPSADKLTKNTQERRRKQRDEADAAWLHLASDYRQKVQDPRYKSMLNFRKTLPVFAQRDEILATIKSHRCMMVAGMPGCGKSTQVPQFVLEEALEAASLSRDGGWTGSGGERHKGGRAHGSDARRPARVARCHIICAQPRRVAAVSLANRVAAERAERVGETVGYQVRLDSKVSSKTALIYCTNGVLLRRLTEEQSLAGVTHVFLDEVHERSMEMDMLLVALRRACQRSKGNLRVIAMSATARIEEITNYLSTQVDFTKGVSIRAPTDPRATNLAQNLQVQPNSTELTCGVTRVPGRTFPIATFYLEDAVCVGEFSFKDLSPDGQRVALNYLRIKSSKADGGCLNRDSPAVIAQGVREERNTIMYIVIAKLVASLVPAALRRGAQAQGDASGGGDANSGAILVFLPGVAEITACGEAIESEMRRSSQGRDCWVVPLHGAQPPEVQQRAFKHAPRGQIKVVLSTNIAETSVTIDDIVTVIDTGLVKIMRYDPVRRVSELRTSFTSRASSKQREGRAGRVRAGVCYRLYPRGTFDSMAEDDEPEMLRTPLEQCVLQAKVLCPAAKVATVLAEAPTPPASESVVAAIKALFDLGALALPLNPATNQPDSSKSETLTALGMHLVRLPLDVKLGKLLVMACVLGCVKPALAIAAAFCEKSPFLHMTDISKEEGDRIRKARASLSDSCLSDDIAVANAVSAYHHARRTSFKAGREVCATYALHEKTMQNIGELMRHYASALANSGLLPSREYSVADYPTVNDLRGNVVKTALCSSLYPNVLRIVRPTTRYVETVSGAMPCEAEAKQYRFVDKAGSRAFLSPGSVNFSVRTFDHDYLTYQNLVTTSKTFARETTTIPPLALLLFTSGRVDPKHAQGMVELDGWIKYKASAKIAVVVKELRKYIESLLLRKLDDPDFEFLESPIVRKVLDLLAR
eukprot:Rmarinus@m.29717